jgi:hypothetical protein
MSRDLVEVQLKTPSLCMRSLLEEMKQLTLDSSIHNTHTHAFSPMFLGAGLEVEEGIDVKNQENNELPDGSKKYYNGVYSGELKDGKRHGSGQMQYNKVEYWFPYLYQGNWENDAIQGAGEMQYNDKSVYDGLWVRGNRHGLGKMTYNNGDVYNGCWVNDRKEGEGTMTFKNKDEYKGIWEKDNMHSGTYTNASQTWRFTGKFENAYPCAGTLKFLENGVLIDISSEKWQRKKIYEEKPVAVDEEKPVPHKHNAHTTGKQKPKTEQLQKIIEKCKDVATSIQEGLDDAWEFIQDYGNEYDNPRGGFQKLTPQWKSNW